MKRLAFVCLATAFLVACQDAQLPTDAPNFGKGGVKAPQAQINELLKDIFPPGTRGLPGGPNDVKAQIFDAVGDGDTDLAAQLFFNDMMPLLDSSEGDSDDIANFFQLFLDFIGIQGNSEVIDPSDGGVVTNDGTETADAGVFFDEGELPGSERRVVTVLRRSQPCHPLSLLPVQEDGCYEFIVTPPLGPTETFNSLDGVLVGVCYEGPPADFGPFRLFRSEGPDANSVELLPEAETPDFLDCNGEIASRTGSWLQNFATATWENIGAPLVDFLGPKPLEASVLTLGTSGSLGGRTKKFSNIGWAELGIDDGFEEDAGWTATGFWHRSTLKSGGSSIINKAFTDELVSLAPGDASAGALPSPAGGDYVFWYGEEADGNYIGTRANSTAGSGGTSTTANSGTLTSPVFRVPDDEDLGDDAVLRFDAWFEIESVDAPAFDLMDVFIEEVDGPTSLLGRLNPTLDYNGNASIPFTSGGFNAPPVWFEVEQNLNAFRGKTVRLKFEFSTEDVLYNGFRGWVIDNLQVTTEQVVEASISASVVAGLSKAGGLNPPQPLKHRDSNGS